MHRVCSAQPKPLVHIFSGPLYKQKVKNHLCSSYLNVIYLPINNSCVNNELMSTSAWVCQIQDLQRVAQYLSVVHLVSLLHLKWTNNCTQSSFPQLSRLFGREFVGLRVIPTSNVCHQAWNFISEKARPTLICKGRLPWKILKFIGNFWMRTKAKTRGNRGQGLKGLCGLRASSSRPASQITTDWTNLPSNSR